VSHPSTRPTVHDWSSRGKEIPRIPILHSFSPATPSHLTLIRAFQRDEHPDRDRKSKRGPAKPFLFPTSRQRLARPRRTNSPANSQRTTSGHRRSPAGGAYPDSQRPRPRVDKGSFGGPFIGAGHLLRVELATVDRGTYLAWVFSFSHIWKRTVCRSFTILLVLFGDFAVL
jgi:hypothetical protein